MLLASLLFVQRLCSPASGALRRGFTWAISTSTNASSAWNSWPYATTSTVCADPTLSVGRLPRTAIDTGGGSAGRHGKAQHGETSVTDLAYRFWRRLKLQGHTARVRLVKGASSKTGPRIDKTYPDNRNRRDRRAQAFGDVPVHLLNVHLLKDEVWNRVGRDAPGPGYMHWPDWLHHSFFDELTAEIRTATGWDATGAPNETFDLDTYAAGLCYDLGADKINWDAPPAWCAPWDASSEVRPVDPDGMRNADREPLPRRARRVRFRMT